ncbi:MAG: SurA N-terminal domain-containing protein [Eggerthellaceae bacterium]|nr:SurA N-terminal domain-containing protein [Eggerthellaceae bacterium]
MALSIVLVSIVLCACAAQEQKAAEFGGAVISEDEVTAYTEQFRQRASLTDDASWRVYLAGQSMDAKQWRESAIRSLATEALVRNRAQELGIEASEEDVADSVAAAKARYGVAQGDEAAWKDALESIGYTPEEYRASCELASIEQQLVATECASQIEASKDKIQEYLAANLADRVIRDFSVLTFAGNDEDAARAAFEELSGLQGAELAARFEEMVEQQSADADVYSGRLGWDVLYGTEGVLDPDKKINVMGGELYPELVDAQGQWQIYLCNKRFVFEPGVTYETIEDQSLRKAIEQLALSSNLASITQSYLSNLVEQANVQVYSMPEGLPYDLED